MSQRRHQLGAAQPAPSDTIYMQVYQTFLNSLKDHLAKECCKLAHHATCQRMEWSCCFAATSVPDDWQGY
jgi:hypothetical protein